ncbi:hypothetical protein NFI96_030058 [Prochilodus magdalenae]|nr:hypothetical protein NFI96_030058 [Prochilodus magdalenae]
MGRLTEMSLLCVLLMASSAFGAVVTPASEAEADAHVDADAQVDADVDFSALVKEQLSEPRKDVQDPMACPYGWVMYHRRCYKYFAHHVDWATAEATCMHLGGHLVSIHNAAENHLVKILIRHHDWSQRPTWLGLSDCQRRNTWLWSDGTRYQYSKWNRHEPNHSHGECCVHINWSGQKDWNDIPCNHRYPFVCTRKL